MRVAICFILSCFLSFPASIGIAQHDNFPPELQMLVAGQTPLKMERIGNDVPGFFDEIGFAWSFLDTTENVVNYVLCYPLGADSITESIFVESPVEMTGVVYVYFPEIIDISSPDQFLLFFQQVSPEIGEVFPITGEIIDLQVLTQDGIESNFSEYCIFDSESFDCLAPACVDSLNNLQSGNQPAFCLSGCCGVGAEFRLPGFEFVGIGDGLAQLNAASEFDFSDPNFRRFFRHYSFFTGMPDFDKFEPFFAFQDFEIPLYQPGDTNMDGQINLLDVAGFLDCLTAGEFVFQCDINGDLIVDLLDVGPFVDLLSP